jgi:ABC-2 type transport system permease protein
MARSAAEEIDGYVVLPPDVRETARVQFRSARVAEPSVLRDIRTAATEAVQADRLARAGVRLDLIADAFRPVTLDDGRVRRDGAAGGTSRANFLLAYFIAMIVYMMIAMYGSAVTRSVLEEKTNRIAELLVSSISARQLIAGKILGVGTAVLIQMLSWVLVLGLLVSQSTWVSQQLNIDPAALDVITAQPLTTLLLVSYAILGFLFFAALFAALGAAVASDQEAQSLQMLLMLPLFVPLLFLIQLTTDPSSTLARTLGIVPFTSPIAMPMRMAAARVEVGDVVASITLLAVAVVLATFAAAGIYRAGILTAGRRIRLGELITALVGN